MWDFDVAVTRCTEVKSPNIHDPIKVQQFVFIITHTHCFIHFYYMLFSVFLCVCVIH